MVDPTNEDNDNEIKENILFILRCNMTEQFVSEYIFSKSYCNFE